MSAFEPDTQIEDFIEALEANNQFPEIELATANTGFTIQTPDQLRLILSKYTVTIISWSALDITADTIDAFVDILATAQPKGSFEFYEDTAELCEHLTIAHCKKLRSARLLDKNSLANLIDIIKKRT